MVRCQGSVHEVHIPYSDVWSIYLELSQQRDTATWWTEEIIGWKILRWLIFSSAWLWLHAWQYILFLSDSRILGIITSIYPESGLWCVGTLWHERGSGIQGNDVMGATIITRDIPSLRAASNGEINCITNWPQFRFIIGHICMEAQWMIITWTMARAGPMSGNT